MKGVEYMKERKKKRFVQKQLTATIVILDMMVIFACILLWLWKVIPNNNGTCIKIIISIIIFSDLIMFYPLILKFQNDFDKKYSKEMVERYLSTIQYKEVMPRNPRTAKHYDFIEGITEIAGFYAIISEESGEVIVIVVFDKEQKQIFYEAISKEKFYKHYMLLNKNMNF